MKKLLLTLGTLATIAAPVAAVVSCGSSNESGNSEYTDGTATHTKGGDAIDQMISGSKTATLGETNKEGYISPYQHFALNADFIADRFFNTKSDGIIKNVTRSNWFKDEAAFIFFGHKSVKDSETSKAVIDATTKTGTTKTITFTKKDIISSADFFSDKVKSLKLDSSKQYIYSVVETTKDTTNNEGVYKLIISESNSTKKVEDATSILKDDFAFSDQSIKELSGMYLFSQSHMFKLGDSTFGLEHMSTSHKGAFNDRANNDNLIDWTGYAPKAALTDEQKAKLSGLTIMSKLVVDRKTSEQNVQLTIKDSTNVTKTIYFATRKIAELNAVKTFDIDEFSKLWKTKVQFKPIYDLVSKLKDDVGQMSSLGTNGLFDHFIEVSSRLNLVASSYKFSNTEEFINAFGNYLNDKADFNANAMLSALENIHYPEFNDITTLGSKGYIGLYWVKRIYGEFEKFIDESTKTHPEWKLTKIDSLDSLNKILEAQANK